MHCTRCGAPLPPGAGFCPSCGQPVFSAPAAAVPPMYAGNAPSPNAPASRKQKGCKIASILLFVLGALLFWVPVVGVLLCVVALILNILMKKRQGKHTALIILSGFFLVIGLLITGLILSNIETVDSAVEDYAVEKLCSLYGGTLSGTPSLACETVEKDTYRVTGEMTISQIVYLKEEEHIYSVQVDCTVYHPNDGKGTFRLVKNNSAKAKEPDKVKALPAAITRISEKEAVKQAEKFFHNQVKLKNEASYVLNDSIVTASYTSSGEISVVVVLDYSAQNSFGGMTRNGYKVEMLFGNGKYRFVKGTKLS